MLRRIVEVALMLSLSWVLSPMGRASTGAAPECPTFASGQPLGFLLEPRLVEASGLVASRSSENVLWSQNDSGSPPELFAFAIDGTALGTYALSGASNVDWEDLAIGPGPVPGVDYVFVGDIGDNDAVRDSVTVYRVPEPTVGAAGSFVLTGVVALEMTYPDGPRDAETLLSDPLTGDLYIMTKNLSEGVSSLYRYPFPHADGHSVVLERVGTHTFHGNRSERAATAGDISTDGREVIVRTYARAWLWPRPIGTSVANAMARPPCEIPIPSEPQGEGVAFAVDRTGYYTTSERVAAPVYFLRRLSKASTSSGAVVLVLAGCAAAFVRSRAHRARSSVA
jgi:hypothetical protein